MDVTKIILELLVINIECKIQTIAEKQLLIATSIEPELDFSKLKNLFYFSCVCVCMYACMQVSWELEEGVRIPGSRVKGVCELLDMGAENCTWVL